MVRLAFVLLLLAPVSVAAQGTRAPVRLGELESVGALDTKTAKDRISKVLPQLRACVVGEDGKSRVSGIARYRALVVADGTMIATEVASSSLGDRSIERCLAEALKTVTFPEARDGRDTHLHLDLLVGDERTPSAEVRRATGGPGDPEFDEREDPTPAVPETRPSPQVLVSIRALQGELTKEAEERASSRAVRAFRACYEPRLAASPGLAGRIALRTKITPRGEAREVKLAFTTLPQALTDCVVRAAQLIPFEAPTREVVTEWTIVLAPPP